MAKIQYNPGRGMPVRDTFLGYDFDAGRGSEPTEVPEGRALTKLRAMQPHKGEGEPGTDGFVPWFQVLDDEPASGDGSDLKATHNGGGRFIIVHGEGDDDVLKGLDKAAADAFNALSDEDKAAYVEAHKEPSA